MSGNMLLFKIISYTSAIAGVLASPPGFPSTGNGMWYTSPGTNWATDYIPVGNGYLGATTPGGSSQEATSLNIETLWSGGPFADSSYNGGNKQPSDQAAMTAALKTIRQTIFASDDGTIDNIEELTTDAGAYGSYVASAYLFNTINVTGEVSDYYRWLDMDAGIARTSWTQDGATFLRELLCSYPSKACVQHLNSTTTLPSTNYTFGVYRETDISINTTCLSPNVLQVRSTDSSAMQWEILGSVQATGEGVNVTCAAINSTSSAITVEGATEAWITWVGGTEYDIDAGNADHEYSFKGADPHEALVTLTQSVAAKAYADVVAEHTADYFSILGPFALDLGQTVNLADSTDIIVKAYQTDEGDAYLEWLLFNFGRYLLVGSARGQLPANLQGVWTPDSSSPWSADYHANINLQMNYWFAELTNMDVTQSLWDYMEKTWAPRGSYTAQVLYNSRGWVTHNEMNIFGHTGMKASGNDAQWADYPASNAWMALHMWDHFDFTNDVNWWKSQGYPLLKGVALFHLDNLLPDFRSNDTELVVSPCNSPEQQPITYGCAHYQQLIWQVLNSVEKGFSAAGDTDSAFLAEVQSKREAMDKGVRVGWWGEIMEWKAGLDSSTDTHRHLSHLVGLYPGYAILTYDPALQPIHVNGTYVNYTREDVLDAAKVSLIHRGNGTGPDADAGWEKVWRAASWASLKSGDDFYHELSYAVFENFAANLYSIYSPEVFQIDANFGFSAALLNALIQIPDTPQIDTPLTVTLLPALPTGKWSSGSIKGARIRSGLLLDFSWSGGKLSSVTVRSSEFSSSATWTTSGSKGRQVVLVNGQTGSTMQTFWTGDVQSDMSIPV